MHLLTVGADELPALMAASTPVATPPLRVDRPHGTHVRYVQGPDENDIGGAGCRCEPCREAANTYERDRRQRIEPAYVPAGPARQHLAWLREQGVGLKQVAKRAGVAHGTLSKLVYGDPARGMPPSRRVCKATLDAILAIRPADGADGSRVPAGPTLALVDRLVAAGVPKARIAEHLGQRGPGLQLGRSFVTRRNAVLVRRMADELERGELVTVRRSRHGATIVAPKVEPPEPTVSDAGDQYDQVLLGLVELLEQRIDNRSWHADAACRGRPTWLWFPGRGDHDAVARAKKVCGACLVRSECLDAHLSERDGIYGGLSARERALVRSDRPALVRTAAT